MTLTSPTSGATYTAPASIALAATASDSDGTVARVDFYAGSTLLGSDTAAPFQCRLEQRCGRQLHADGTRHRRRRCGHDVGGRHRHRQWAGPTLTGARRRPHQPAGGATLRRRRRSRWPRPRPIATARSPRVDFYAGSTLLGTDTLRRSNVTWNNVAAGSLHADREGDRQRRCPDHLRGSCRDSEQLRLRRPADCPRPGRQRTSAPSARREARAPAAAPSR